MEIQMPEMGVLTATAAIRKRGLELRGIFRLSL